MKHCHEILYIYNKFEESITCETSTYCGAN